MARFGAYRTTPGMALFSSAFDAGISHASSSKAVASPKPVKPHKRKRPPAEQGSGEKDDQLRATQANLERLMDQVAKGEVKNRKDGTEVMGLPGKSKKKKGRETGITQNRPPKQDLKKLGLDQLYRSTPATLNSSNPRASNLGKQSEPRRRLNEPGNIKDSASTGKQDDWTSRPTPAELLSPLSISASDLRMDDGSKVEGLTDLQRGMKSKLEAARFR